MPGGLLSLQTGSNQSQWSAVRIHNSSLLQQDKNIFDINSQEEYPQSTPLPVQTNHHFVVVQSQVQEYLT